MPRFSGTLVEDGPRAQDDLRLDPLSSAGRVAGEHDAARHANEVSGALSPVNAMNGARRPRFSGMLVEDAGTAQPETSNGYKMARAGYLGALDGASLSFGDELGAGLGAASEYIASFIPGQPEGRSYNELLTKMREQDAQAKAEAPGTYMVGQLAGGVATTAPIAGAGIVGGAARSLPARLAISGGTGAATGAAQGFGAGEGDFQTRLDEAGTGFMIGGGLGLASIPAGKAIGAGVNAVSDLIASRGVPMGRASQDMIRRTLAEEGLTLKDAGRLAQQMGPSAMLADATEGLRLRAEQIAQSDNPARAGVIAALKDRGAAAGGRINSAYDEALGPRPNVQQTLSTMAKDAKSRADPLYARARTENLPVDVNPVIGAIDDQLMTPAERIAGRPDLPSDDVDNALSWVRSHLTDGTSQRTGIDHLDRLERRVRAKTKAAFEGGRSDVGHALNEVGKVLRGQLKASSPVYAEARQTFADDMSVKEAFETGQKLFAKKTHPDFLAAEVADMSDAERQALQLGVRSAVDEAMGSVRNGSLKGRQLLDADWNERKILQVLGEDDGRKLINALNGEQQMAETANQAIGNSATSRRMDNPFRVQQRTAQDRPVAGILRSAGNLDFGDAAARAIQYGTDALGRRQADAMAREVGPFLTSTGQTREQRIMEALRAGESREAAAAEAQKRKAIAEALLQTGGLAAAPQFRR